MIDPNHLRAIENSPATALRNCHSSCLNSFSCFRFLPNSNTDEINTLVHWTQAAKAALRMNALHYHTMFERVMKGFRRPCLTEQPEIFCWEIKDFFFHSSGPSTTLFSILVLGGEGKGQFSFKDWLPLEPCQYKTVCQKWWSR